MSPLLRLVDVLYSFYSIEEECVSGFDTHIILDIRINSLLVLVISWHFLTERKIQNNVSL